MRVAVVVALADRDDAGARADGREEARCVRVAPVVRDLEDVGPQPPRLAEQLPLRLGLDVAREQDATRVVGDPQDHRGVVRTRGGLGGRPEHVHRRRPEREPVSRPHRDHGDVARTGGSVGGPDRRGDTVALDRPRTHHEGRDVEVREHRGEPARVIVVRVAQHHRVEAADTPVP